MSFTLPPINLQGDEYSNFDPTRPNPAANNYPGAVVFAGFGQGRENSRSLVPGWYGGIGPRIGMAYSPDNKTTFRVGIRPLLQQGHRGQRQRTFRRFCRPVRVQFARPGSDAGLQLGQRISVLHTAAACSILPSRITTRWITGSRQDAARAPENMFWTFSIQRQVSANTVIEAAYNANVGTHLQAGLVNVNQTPTAYLNQFIQQYGATQALNLLRADINSPQARAAGIPIPYPNFTNPQIQQVQTVNQALRPFPQYQTVITGAQGGDKSGHLTYHAFVLKAERRYSNGLTFQWNYVLSKLITDADSYNAPGGAGAAQDQYNRGLEKSIGAFDQTHVLKMSTVYELPFGRDKRFLTKSGMVGHLVGGWRASGIAELHERFPDRARPQQPVPDFQWYHTAGDHKLRQLAGAHQGRASLIRQWICS